MMNKMVVANLVQRPTRSLITMSAVALEVTMILMVVALFYGLLNGSKESQVGVGADLMVMPTGIVRAHSDVGSTDFGQSGKCPGRYRMSLMQRQSTGQSARSR
jgi:hypothetical protein